MKRGAPMKQSGFKRKEYTKPARPVYEPMPADVAARVRTGAVSAQKARPKATPQRNARLLAMARNKPCLLMLPTCNCDPATTVAAHSNQSKHGKSAGRKADDQYSVWGGYACHVWLDQGGAPQEEKVAAWDAAHARQVIWWQAIANSMAYPPADRAAARWALERLGL